MVLSAEHVVNEDDIYIRFILLVAIHVDCTLFPARSCQTVSWPPNQIVVGGVVDVVVACLAGVLGAALALLIVVMPSL